MSVTASRSLRGTRIRATGKDAQAIFDAMTAPFATEEKRQAHDRSVDAGKTDGTADRVAAAAALRLDLRYGTGQ